MISLNPYGSDSDSVHWDLDKVLNWIDLQFRQTDAEPAEIYLLDFCLYLKTIHCPSEKLSHFRKLDWGVPSFLNCMRCYVSAAELTCRLCLLRWAAAERGC